jgi:hypothetical protein
MHKRTGQKVLLLWLVIECFSACASKLLLLSVLSVLVLTKSPEGHVSSGISTFHFLLKERM